MAKTNVALPATGSGFWADLVGGGHYQYLKLMAGAEGAEVPIFGTRPIARVNVTGATTVDIDCSGAGTIMIEWSGTFSGLTGSFKVDFGNGVWDTAHTFQIYDLSNNNHFVSFNSIGSARRILVNAAGMARLRMDVTAISSGQCDVDMAATSGVFPLVPANQQITCLTSAARTTTTSSSTLSNYHNRGGVFNFNVTVASTGSQTFSAENQDRLSSVWYAVFTGAAVTTTGMRNYLVYPGAGSGTATELDGYSDAVVGRIFRVTLTANNANSQTSSVGHDAMI